MNENYGSAKDFYKEYYDAVLFGKNLGSKAITRIHKDLESGLKCSFFNKVLELGSGEGQHLKYVSHAFSEYVLLDIQEPINKFEREGVRFVRANAENLPFEDGYFDRVVVTCLLHHVDEVETVLNEILRVLNDNGKAHIFVSCDPGVLVRMLRRLTVEKKANKLGYSGYKLMIAREHKNHFVSILEKIKYVYRDHTVKISFRPFRFATWNLNAYVIVRIYKKCI